MECGKLLFFGGTATVKMTRTKRNERRPTKMARGEGMGMEDKNGEGLLYIIIEGSVKLNSAKAQRTVR